MNSDTKTTLEENFRKVLNSFDFVLVQKVMEFMKWEWSAHQRSPNLVELKEMAKSLFQEAMENVFETSRETVSCGGLQVEVCLEDEFVSLSFVVLESKMTGWESRL